MQITEQQHKAAQEIVDLIARELGENRAVHSGTAISSCARLAGSFMFRSFNFEMKNINPGNAVLSNEANEKGPVLINIIEWVLSNLGVKLDSKKLGGTSAPESNLNFLDCLNLLQNKAATIMKRNKLEFEEMAYSCAMASAFIIQQCQQDVPVESGFNSAIYGVIEGCKTYPPEFSEQDSRKKGFFSFWRK